MREIALAECNARRIGINFTDPYCLDMGPYVVLGLMFKDFERSLVMGGKIKLPIRKVLDAVGVSEFLSMTPLSTGLGSENIWPMHIVESRPPESSGNVTHTSHQEVVIQDFVGRVNNWLNTVGWSLNPEGDQNLSLMIAEILDNARLHGKPTTGDADWWLCGFMANREEGDLAQSKYICHITIVNTGVSISDSMQTCSMKLRKQIEHLIEFHQPLFGIGQRPWSEKALWTLYALQDGVTRIDDPSASGGCGMMEFIEFFGTLCDWSGVSTERPGFVIISGDTCIRVDGPSPNLGPMGKRTLALNASNNLKDQPDPNHIWTMSEEFPGTILTMRFTLNSAYLAKVASDDNNH